MLWNITDNREGGRGFDVSVRRAGRLTEMSQVIRAGLLVCVMTAAAAAGGCNEKVTTRNDPITGAISATGRSPPFMVQDADR